MIAGERTTAYINSLDRGNTEFLNQIEREAKEACVPIIRQEMQSLLKTLLAAKKPKAVLEVGTAVGFSALLMCEYGPRDMRLTTIEKYEKRIPVAKENFRRAGREGQITFLEGDAAEILSRLTGSYDFIFMVLQDGDIMESRFAVERRNRTIHSRMREYLYTLTHHPELTTSVLPLGDGVTLSVKRETAGSSPEQG